MDDAHAVAGSDHSADHGDEHGNEHSAAAGHHGEAKAYPGFKAPGLIEIGTFLGFLSLFFLVTLAALSKANLVPVHDPYLEESLHHHV